MTKKKIHKQPSSATLGRIYFLSIQDVCGKKKKKKKKNSTKYTTDINLAHPPSILLLQIVKTIRRVRA